jgi:hypothetical protein
MQDHTDDKWNIGKAVSVYNGYKKVEYSSRKCWNEGVCEKCDAILKEVIL